jgi:hypothetical protein
MPGLAAGSNRSRNDPVSKGLQPGSLSQKKIDLVEKPGSGGFVLQKEVIPPGKRYETSTWNPSRHLTAHIDRDHEIDGNAAPEALSRIMVLDEASARIYVDKQNEITYLPREIEVIAQFG